MKAYNFLRIGADLVNASDAADKKAREVEQAEAHRKQAESSTEANNALVELRRRQTGELDAKAAQEKEMRDLLGNMDLNDPKVIPMLMQMGHPDLANTAYKFQNQQKKEFLLGAKGFLQEIDALPPDKRADAYKARMDSYAKLYPAMAEFAAIPYDPNMVKAIQDNINGLLASEPKEHRIPMRKGADGRWYPEINGKLGEPQGPAAAPKAATGALTPKQKFDMDRTARLDAEKAAKEDEAIQSARIAIQNLVKNKQWAPQVNEEQVKLQILANKPFRTEAYKARERKAQSSTGGAKKPLNLNDYRR